MNDNAILRIERAHPNLLSMQSEVKSVTYFTAIDDDRIVMTIDRRGEKPLGLALTVEQAYAISQELKHMLSMVGRGRAVNEVGRKHR